MKTYQEYCLEALSRQPKIYKPYFNSNGKPKAPPIMSGFLTKKTLVDIPKEELKKLPKDGFTDWPVNKTKIKTKNKIKITGTQIVMSGKKIDMQILSIQKGCSIREYNKVWMHNYRVRCRIKKLKEKFGITFTL
jgi:hypothetical protein